MQPLPEGGLPADQTVEGGAQLRISPAGFNKLTAIIPAMLNDTLADGFCLPSGSSDIIVGDINYCYENDGTCSSACQVDFTIDSINVSVPADDQLRIRAQFDAAADVPVNFDPFIGGPIGCTMTASADNIVIDARINFLIDPTTGELGIELQEITSIDVDITVSGCSFVSDVINFIVGIFEVAIENDFLRGLVTPLIEDLVQGLLPDPLGLEGVADLSNLFASVSPGTNALLEARLVPGGYVELENSGLSLGIITGINADENLATRSADLDSEPALCVPPFAAPDFSIPPASLTTSTRGNFTLAAADAFSGMPDADHDILIGASETTLDLLGHHLVTSGAMCLSLGTELIPQLNLAAIGILVPSLAELGTEDGDDPLLLVTRPVTPLDISIGEGTPESPALTLHIKGFEIDFYAFLFERYTRGFTVALDLNVGINLEFTTDANGNPALMPMLSGLEAENITVTVSNQEFLRESKETLEAVFPSLLDLVLPLIGDSLGAITLPDIAGFSLGNLEIEKVTTSEDEFLAIGASLAASQAMRALGEHYPSVANLAREFAPEGGQPTSARAQLVEVKTPAPHAIRAQLLGQPGGAMPEIILDLDVTDALGRELEWTWNLDGGIWRQFVPGGRVHLRDGAFAVMGKYELQLRARARGDYRSWDPNVIKMPVVIDSVAPKLLVDRIERTETELLLSAWDIVFKSQVEFAVSAPTASEPATVWGPGAFDLGLVDELTVGGELRVWVRDPEGNLDSRRITVPSLQVSTAGCSASNGSAGILSGLALLALLALARTGRRHAYRIAGALLVFGMATAPACSCGDPAGQVCMLSEECEATCEEDQIAECFDGQCRCLDDVRYGRIGEFSSMALAEDGMIWIAGYNSTHGDLMVTSTTSPGRIADESWTYVDGVPDGPVTVPGSTVRGGISAPGEDVGRYTDIVVTEGGAPMVSYFDHDSGSLKFATLSGGEWHTHVVEAGDLTGGTDTLPLVAGQYSAISLRADGAPGIAYFAHVGAGTEEARTEVRFAQATTPEPRGAADWQLVVVDLAAVPAEEAEEDILKVPYGVGLFIDIARMSDDTPILAYYDRLSGDLKLARFDGEAGAFVPEVLDGEGNVGWYPSLVVDSSDIVHVSYVDRDNQDLLYINDLDRTAELVDDGYRIVGTTEDGLPKPEFHFVGDDSGLVFTSNGPHVAYQDATTHELLVATKDGNGNWRYTSIAGSEDPFVGAYGFFANVAHDGADLTLSSWVVDQANHQAWVEVFRRGVIIE